MPSTAHSTSALSAAGLLIFGVLGTAHGAGLLAPSDGSLPPLEIRSQQVNVDIEDGYAITTVEQVFHNPHDRDLEAIYSFPVPEHGSVGEFTVWIDGKPVTGEVLPKEKAREIYEQEKSAGHDAGLASKDEYKTFDIHVSPVRARQDVRTRFVYLQPVTLDHGIGRYVYPLEEGGVDEQKMSFWTSQSQVQERFDFNVHLRSGYPIEALRVPGQTAAQVAQVDEHRWEVSLHAGSAPTRAPADDAQEAAAAQEQNPSLPASAYMLDRDLVVYWRMKQDLPGSVDLVTYKPDAGKRGTFMLTLTPGDDLPEIDTGSDWLFVLDVSGSMVGKYTILAEGVRQALARMRPQDRFRIITFNDQARELTSQPVAVTEESIQEWTNRVVKLQPDRSTNLYAGLELALKKLDADRPSGIILITDGVANVGETEQRSFLGLLDQKDVRLFTVIMGNSANRPLLEALTDASNGFASSVSNSDDIVGQILSATSKLTHAALHGVSVKINGVRVSDLTPEHPGSLYRGQQLMMLGHYQGAGEATVTLDGTINGQTRHYEGRFRFPEQSSANPEIERLWAYDRIRGLKREIDTFGETPDRKQGIVDLATEYGLVTDYTSMVVVRDEIFRQLGIDRRNARRSEIEQAARMQRAAQVPVSPQADVGQPMFTAPRVHFGGGGGAISGWDVVLMFLAVLLITWWRRHRNRDAVIAAL